MPSLRQRPDGRFFIDYRDEFGQRQRPYIIINGERTRDPIAAQAYYDHWLKNQTEARGTATQSRVNSPWIKEILDYYRDVYLIAQNAAQATHNAAQTHCAAFLEWCRSQHIGRMQQLNVEVMTRWSADLQTGEFARGARTTANYLNTIRSAINVAVEAELIPRSPIKKWSRPKFDATDKHPLSIQELEDVIALFSDSPIILWMALTGQRPSDARTLKFGDVDLETLTVHRPSVKVRNLRKFEICPQAGALVAAAAVREHTPGDIVFLSPQGRPWSEDGPLNLMRRRCEAENHPRRVTPKMLRDSFGTIMANDIGLPLPELQILMGHTDIKTTMQYVRARGARQWLTQFDTRLTLRDSPRDLP